MLSKEEIIDFKFAVKASERALILSFELMSIDRVSPPKLKSGSRGELGSMGRV